MVTSSVDESHRKGSQHLWVAPDLHSLQAEEAKVLSDFFLKTVFPPSGTGRETVDRFVSCETPSISLSSALLPILSVSELSNVEKMAMDSLPTSYCRQR